MWERGLVLVESELVFWERGLVFEKRRFVFGESELEFGEDASILREIAERG